MFPSGGAQVNDRTRRLMQQVAQVVSKLPNKLAISGHTDAQPFRGGGAYSNWELSADRANAARRQMIEAGVPAERIRQVTGNADQDPMIKDNPLDARNRRIAILLLSDLPPAGAQQGGLHSGRPEPCVSRRRRRRRRPDSTDRAPATAPSASCRLAEVS